MTKLFRLYYLPIFFFAWFCQGHASYVIAQERDVFSVSLEDLINIEVTTASQTPQKISDVPAHVISFTAEQIQLFGWRDLKDVFRSVTGVDVSYDVQGEVKTLVTLRGIEGNQKILVLQDGHRLNPITGERFIFGHNIPLYPYSRVEIVFGPASAIYGADAYAGVINLISKDATDIDGFRGGAGYVSTQAMDAHLIFGKELSPDVAVLLMGRVYQGEDFKWHKHYTDPLDYAVVNQYRGALAEKGIAYPINNWNLMGKINYGRAILGFDWQHQLESNAPSSIPENYAYVKNNVWGQDVRHLNFVYYLPETDRLAMEVSAHLGDYALNPATNFYIPNEDLTEGTPKYKHAYSAYARSAFKARYQYSEKVMLSAGATFDYVRSFPKTQNLDQPFAHDGPLQDDLRIFRDENAYIFGLIGLTDSLFGTRNYRNAGLFVESEYRPIDRLRFTLGSRYDYNTIYKGAFNPRLGVVFRANEQLTLKALFGTAYIQPSNYYRWENWANPFGMHIPNQEIRPERLRTYELGANYYFNGNLSVRTSFFHNHLLDIIRPVPAKTQAGNYPYYNPYRTLVGESPQSGFVIINDNLGHMHSYGAEVDVNYRLNPLLFALGYTLLYGEDVAFETEIPKVSRHKLNLSVLFSNEKFSGSLALRYYSAISTAPSNSHYQGKGKIPGAAILYAHLNYVLTNSLSWRISGENLLNTRHWGAAPYGESEWIQSRAPQALLKVYTGVYFAF